ncbi:MAG: hypothetical protein GY733_18020 [bacterium]|nr:hypothetical protein [bacterium]MCP5067935.1 hypothetical protein [bacterium]
MAAQQPPKAIRSLREDDVEVEVQIDDFIAHLGEIVDHIQDLEAAGDPEVLARHVLELSADATELGYPALASATERVASACGEQNSDAVRKAVVDLTNISQRVRRGHRSSA